MALFHDPDVAAEHARLDGQLRGQGVKARAVPAHVLAHLRSCATLLDGRLALAPRVVRELSGL
jgi:hypothetical protein